MHIKYFILVSLILAILTIGAASASYDADTLAVDDEVGDIISQADDMDVAGQSDKPGDNLADDRTEVEYEIENTDGDIIPVNDENASIGVEISNEDITGNITVKITGDDETEKVISTEIVPSTPGYYDDNDTYIDGEGGNYILLKDLNLNPGKYNVTVSYDGDDNYLPFNESFVLNYYMMYVDIDDEVYNYFKVYFIEGLTGSIEVFIDNVSYYKSAVSDLDSYQDDNFMYSYIYLYDLSYGPHTYNITYKGKDYTLSEPFVGEFNRNYIFQVSLNDGPEGAIYFGNNVTFDILYPYDADGEIVITYNGKKVTKKIADEDYSSGETQVILSDLNIGENNITFTLKSDKYPEKSVNNTVDVRARFAIPYPIRYGNDEDMISVVLPSDAKGNLVIYISEGLDEDWNDKWKLVNNVTLVDGKAKASVFSLGLGEYKFKIEYDGNDYDSYFDKIDYTYFTIIPDFIYNSHIYAKGNNSVKVVLPDDANDTLNVSIINDDGNGEAQTIYSGVANGTVTIKLPELQAGRYVFKVLYGVDNYEYNFDVIQKPVDPKITASNLNILYTASTKYTVTIYGTDGKVAPNTQVTFLINGKVYKTIKTNAKGIASVALNQKPGTYKITTKALGKEVTKTLKVNHIVKLQKVNVKRSAKKLVIKVTLSKVNGKYIKSKKVTLKFKGKKYTAKTNKKGVVTFTINKNVLKKLKNGKKVTYQATYLKDTVKRTVKVKK